MLSPRNILRQPVVQIRSRSRRPILAAFAFAVFATATVAGLMPSAAERAEAQSPPADIRSLLRQHLEAVTKGDAATAASFFADDVVLVRGNCSALKPCVGKTEAQAQMTSEVRNEVRFTILSIDTAGDIATARIELRNLTVESQGLDRVIAVDTATFSSGKMSKYVREFDSTDGPTTSFLSFRRIFDVFTALNTSLLRGDVTAALSFFSNEPAISGLGSCSAAPCTGKPAVQKELERRVADKVVTAGIVGTQRVSGTVLTNRIEIRSDSIRAAGVERIVATQAVDVPANLIVSLNYTLDVSDAQTAAYLAALASPAPPKTGNSGTPNRTRERANVLGLGLLLFSSSLTGAWAAKRRRAGR